MASLISKRAEMAEDWEDFLYKYLYLCTTNPYDEDKNPTGYVNLGTAVNNMSLDVICEKLSCDEIWSCNTTLLDYREGYGIPKLREAFARMFTEFLETHEPVSSENIFCLTGATSCIDLLAHCLADPGDVFLSPTPTYGRVYTDFKQRSQVTIWPVPIISADNIEDYPVLTLEKVIKAYENAISEKHVVRGLFLINPNNPLGDVYSPELLMEIFSFCHEHSLHVIVDEIYALSVFSKPNKFYSTLKFSKLPDPERTHIIYGLSKDFGMAGLRIGLIHTTCEPLKRCLIQLSFFQNIPFPLMDTVARYLEDLDWIKGYIETTQKRLAEKYNFCVNYLKKIGLKVRDSPAGFFLWVDFRHICGQSIEQERDFFEYLIEKEHLYINPGKEFYCAQPGWFRIVFTQSPDHLDEGLSRLARAVKEYKHK